MVGVVHDVIVEWSEILRHSVRFGDRRGVAGVRIGPAKDPAAVFGDRGLAENLVVPRCPQARKEPHPLGRSLRVPAGPAPISLCAGSARVSPLVQSQGSAIPIASLDSWTEPAQQTGGSAAEIVALISAIRLTRSIAASENQPAVSHHVAAALSYLTGPPGSLELASRG